MAARATRRLATEICVIGGGPAGSVAAARMAGMGLDVLLLESAAFPRRHIAASLPPECVRLLDSLGVDMAAAKPRFAAARAPIVRWGGEAVHPSGEPHGLHVDRASLDSALLDRARRAGARILQPARAGRPARAADGRWLVPAFVDGEWVEVLSQVLVDAAGRRSRFGRRPRFSPSTVALYSYWPAPPDLGLSGRLDAGDAEWMWCAPAPPDALLAAVFLEPKRLSGLGRESITRLYRDILADSPLIGPLLDGRGPEPVEICDASSRAAEFHASRDLIRVGDASLTVDPLSSQGILLAIASALQAAVVINTLLRRPRMGEAALAFYETRQRRRQEQHARAAAQRYREAGRGNSFWDDRSVGGGEEAMSRRRRRAPEPDCTVGLGRELVFARVPVMEQDLVVEGEAIFTPAMTEPAAFLGEVGLVRLLRDTPFPCSIDEACRRWSDRLPAELAHGLATWFWEHRVLDPDFGSRGLPAHSRIAFSPLGLVP